jgi:hypothetical protein
LFLFLYPGPTAEQQELLQSKQQALEKAKQENNTFCMEMIEAEINDILKTSSGKFKNTEINIFIN